MELTGKESKIDDYETSFYAKPLVTEFWKIRSYVGDIDKPIQKQHFEYSLLNRTECLMIIEMDKVFRNELAKFRKDNDKYIAGKHKK
jgi:hypothetical protein